MSVAFPSTAVKIETMNFRLKHNTQQFESPLSGDVQTLELPGSRWVADYKVVPQSPDQARLMKSFFAQTRGRAVTFAAPVERNTPFGTGNGTPKVNGGGQTGNSIITDGWTPSELVLKEGDYFRIEVGVNQELKVATADVTASSSGAATIGFEPALRASPLDNATIDVNNLTIPMRLVDDSQQTNRIAKGGNYYEGYSFSAVETFF